MFETTSRYPVILQPLPSLNFITSTDVKTCFSIYTAQGYNNNNNNKRNNNLSHFLVITRLLIKKYHLLSPKGISSAHR